METTRRQGSTTELENLGVGLLVWAAWLVFTTAAFATTPWLFAPAGIAYGLLSRTDAIRQRRILRLMAIALSVTSFVLMAFMLWVSWNQTTEIIH